MNWFVRDREGNVVIAQWPNVWLWGFILAWTTSHLLTDPMVRWAGIASDILLEVWVGDEILCGANPWRRSLVAAVLIWLLVGLV